MRWLIAAKDLIVATVRGWSADHALRLGAALAFYTVLSLAPLLIIVIAVAGLVFGQDAVEGRLVDELSSLIGRDSAQLVQGLLARAREPKEGWTATLVGIGTLILGASGVLAQLRDALNQIFNVKPRSRGGIRATIKARLLSLAMVVAIGFLLLVSLVVSVLINAMGHALERYFEGADTAVALVHLAVSLLVISALFGLIFKVLPDIELTWRDVIPGAVLTAVLFAVGRSAIAFYLGTSAVASTYGAAGSLVVMLLWLYYSSQILFLGAEFTQAYAERYGTLRARRAEERRGGPPEQESDVHSLAQT